MDTPLFAGSEKRYMHGISYRDLDYLLFSAARSITQIVVIAHLHFIDETVLVLLML